MSDSEAAGAAAGTMKQTGPKARKGEEGTVKLTPEEGGWLDFYCSRVRLCEGATKLRKR